MIQAGQIEELERAAARARLRIANAENDPVDAHMGQRARAHWARLLRHVKRRAVEPPCLEQRLRPGEGEHLGVGGRVLARLHFVAGLGQDRAVADKDRADGDFLARAGFAGQFQRTPHENRVISFAGHKCGNVIFDRHRGDVR